MKAFLMFAANRAETGGRSFLFRCGLALVLGAVTLGWGIHADAAINTWTINDNLGTSGNWSAGSPPTGSGNAGSYQDALFASASTTGTTSAGTTNLYSQSVNVTNGSSYRFQPGSTSTFNFRVGQTANGAAGEGNSFTNGVSGSAQDLVYLANNSSLTLSGTTTSSPSVTSNFSLRSSGNLRILAGSTFTLEGPVTSGSSSIFTLTKVGGGKVVMGGANTYTALTTISEGTLEYAASNVMADNAPVTVSGGLWDLKTFSDTVGTVTLSSGTIAGTSGGLTIKNDSQFSSGAVSASLTGTSGFTVPTSAGTVVFSGVNTYSGTTKISGGTLRAMSAAALSSASNLNSGGSTSDSSKLDFGAPSVAYQMNALSVGGIMRFTSSTGSASRVTFQAASGNGFSGAAATKILDADANSTVVVTGTFDLASAALTSTRVGRLQGAGNFVFNGPMIGSGTSGSLTAGVSMQGTGTATFNGANTYSGTTDVTAGTLVLGHASALGDGTSGTVLSGGRIDLNGLTLPSSESLTQSGTGSLVNTNSGTAATWAGPVGANGTLGLGGVGNLTLSGSLTGAGNVSKTGSGAVTLTAAAYTGTTGVTAGTLTFGAGSTMSSAGTINVAAGAVLGVQTTLAHDVTGSGTVSVLAGGTLSAASIGTTSLALSGSASSPAAFANTGGPMTSLGSVSLGGYSRLTLSTTGALAATGGVSISGIGNTLALSGATSAGPTYTLLSGTSLTNSGSITLTGAAVGNQTILVGGSTTIGRNTYNFNQTSTALQLAVTGSNFNMVWNGGPAGTWDYTTANWQQDGSGSNLTFVQGDAATIGTASTITVDSGTFGSGVQASSLSVSNAAGTVALSGSAISTTGTFGKSGAGDLTMANAATFGAGAWVSGGSFTSNATTTVSAGGVNVSGGVATLNAASTISGGITVTGGTAAFNAANTVTGAVAASGGGAISLGSMSGVGSGSISLDNGTLISTVASSTLANVVAVGTGGGTIVSTSGFTLSGNVTGTSGITAAGPGEVVLSGSLSSSTTGMSVSVAPGGSARLTGSTLKYLNNTGTVSGTLTFDNATLVMRTPAALTGTGSIVLVGTTTLSGSTGVGSTASITAPISGAGGLVVNGASSRYVILGGSNTYAGGTQLNGDVGAASNSAFGTGPVTSLGTGARINNTSGGVLVVPNNLTTTATATNVLGFTGANPIQITGTVTGAGILRASSGGIIDISQQTLATMQATGSIDMGNGGVIKAGSAANFGSLASILASGTPSPTLQALGNTGTITQAVRIGATNNNPVSFTVDTNGYAVTLGGVIQNLNSGTGGGITKAGSGTLTLTAANTYTGATNVSAGTLLVNGLLDPGSAVTVASAAALGGSGTIGGSVSYSSGANFAFDPAATLTINGATVTFGGFGVTNLQGLSSSTPDGTYTLMGGLATFDLTNVSNVGAGNAYALGGGKTAYLQTAVSPNGFQLVVVPEPTSAVAVACSGLAALVVLARRRRDRARADEAADKA